AENLDCAPRDLRFVTDGPGGRPELAASHPPLRFNLSHTHGLVACVVARAACGVDVESLGTADHDELAPSVLAPTELADYRALPDTERRERLLEIWTLKESYLKGIGLGLSRPLDSVAFTDFGTEPRCNDPAWRFRSARVTARHR